MFNVDHPALSGGFSLAVWWVSTDSCHTSPNQPELNGHKLQSSTEMNGFGVKSRKNMIVWSLQCPWVMMRDFTVAAASPHACRSCPTRAGLLSRIRADVISATFLTDLSQRSASYKREERHGGHLLKNIKLQTDTLTTRPSRSLSELSRSCSNNPRHSHADSHLFMFIFSFNRHDRAWVIKMFVIQSALSAGSNEQETKLNHTHVVPLVILVKVRNRPVRKELQHRRFEKRKSALAGIFFKKWRRS